MIGDKKAVTSLSIRIFLAGLLCLLGAMSAACALKDTPALKDVSDKADIWDGVWFTCEFAQRTSAPDDGCVMFDDEGFRVNKGAITYLRMDNSEETACRGNKKGQCFSANLPEISATEKSIGKIEIGPDWITVRYLGCKQLYHFRALGAFYEAIPDAKKCIWANKRQFYFARYLGVVRAQSR